MLQITHGTIANEKLLEATASQIKQNMNAAARLNFDIEFPEGMHLSILTALGRGDRKMNPTERKAEVQSYFNEIAQSPSCRTSTLPGPQWGGPESLRMDRVLESFVDVKEDNVVHTDVVETMAEWVFGFDASW
jgi:hypothetical protein